MATTSNHSNKIEITRINKYFNDYMDAFNTISQENLKRIREQSNKFQPQHIFIKLLFERNMDTIETINSFNNLGRFDEAMVLMRLTLERSAIAFKSLINDSNIDEIEKLKGSKCINELKNYFPFSGKMYGTFSELCHSNPYPSILFWIYNNIKKCNKKEVSEDLLAAFSLFSLFVIEINNAVMGYFAQKVGIKGKYGWSKNNNQWVYRYDKKYKTFYIYLFSLYNWYVSNNSKSMRNGDVC
jgi:hypothetical protein